MAQSPGQRFSEAEEVNGIKVTVTGERDGQAIVVHPSNHEILIVGFRSEVSLASPVFEWPTMRNIHVQRVRWETDRWANDGEPSYDVDQSRKILEVDVGEPQVLLVTW
jgi:hypothetical protein